MTHGRPASWKVDGSLVAVTVIWGATFVLVKQALADVSTLLFLTLRFSIAAVALALIFRKEFRAPNASASLRRGVLAGIFLFGGYVLQTAGLKFTSASKAGFITGLYVPLVPLIGGLAYRKLPQISELMGVAIAVAGTILLTVQKDILNIAGGDLLVAGCAAAFACHIVILGRFAPTSNLGVLTVAQIGVRWIAVIEHEYNVEDSKVLEVTPLIRLKWWQRILFPDLNFAMHAYHHQHPGVSFGNLPRVHEIYQREGLVDETAIFHGQGAFVRYIVGRR